MKEFAAVEWQRAWKALRSARQLDPESATSRAYYAAFHGLTALFALRGRTFSKHSAVRAALHREWIQSGLLPQDAGRDYDLLMDLRENSDYGGVAQVLPDSAALAVDKAEKFLTALGRLDPDLSGKPKDP